VYSLAVEDKNTLYYHVVKNQVTAAGVKPGTLVLVDSQVNSFQGDGYYLYPNWGTPVVYEIKARQGNLIFYYPGMETPLWKITANTSTVFGGRLEGVVGQVLDDAAINGMPGMDKFQKLTIPTLPVT
jgi:hypothetical protein